MKNVITTRGLTLLLRGLTGSTIEFTKIKFGNGEEQGQSAVDLSNPLVEVGISSITREANYITLAASFLNADVTTDFTAHEIGVYARDPDNPELDILYTFWYEEDPLKADYISPVEDRILGMNLEFRVFVGAVENVTAAIAGASEYVPYSMFNQHTGDTLNPHKVDKDQVGLGNVPNVTPENQKPVFDEAFGSIKVELIKDTVTGETISKTTMDNILSGETMGTILKKVRTAIKALLNHVNASNPHYISAKMIGAAASTHYHSVNDLRTGVLGLARGGTGGANAQAARTNLGIGAGQQSVALTAGEARELQVTFPYAFTTAAPYITTAFVGDTPDDTILRITEVTLTGFTVRLRSASGGTATFNWIACQ